VTNGGENAYERSYELYGQARERMSAGALEEAAAVFRASAEVGHTAPVVLRRADGTYPE
jgi:hypothetical protein